MKQIINGLNKLKAGQQIDDAQIPKKVNYRVQLPKCGLNGLLGDCPVCKSGVDGLQNYCRKCGQALDWSEE